MCYIYSMWFIYIVECLIVNEIILIYYSGVILVVCYILVLEKVFVLGLLIIGVEESYIEFCYR